MEKHGTKSKNIRAKTINASASITSFINEFLIKNLYLYPDSIKYWIQRKTTLKEKLLSLLTFNPEKFKIFELEINIIENQEKIIKEFLESDKTEILLESKKIIEEQNYYLFYPRIHKLVLCLITPEDLGIFGNEIMRDEIYEKAISLGFSLCPIETTFFLSKTNIFDKKEMYFYIASEPIISRLGFPSIFFLSNNYFGKLEKGLFYTILDERIEYTKKSKFLFCIKK